VTVTVVYESETRHVLGALEANGRGAAPDAATLVGAGLPARVVMPDRSAVVDVTVPAERLLTAVVEDTPGLLADPYAFAVEVVNGVARSRLLPLAPWREGSSVTVDSDGVHVNLGRGAPEGTRMLVVLATEDGPAGMFPVAMPTDGSVDLEATLAPGDYGVLTLVGGYAGRVDPGQVT
jgi:hypothetical protein